MLRRWRLGRWSLRKGNDVDEGRRRRAKDDRGRDEEGVRSRAVGGENKGLRIEKDLYWGIEGVG